MFYNISAAIHSARRLQRADHALIEASATREGPLVTIETHVDAIAANTPVPRKFAARTLGLSAPTLTKGIQANVIPEITTGNLSTLVNIPVLTSARTDQGIGIPILRTGVQAESSWDAYTPARRFTGYSSAMTDNQALSAVDRWWPYAGCDSVLAAGCMITAIGGWSVLLLAVDGIKHEHPGGGNCLHYDARLIARCDSITEQQIRVIDPHHPLAERAHDILGKRVLGGGGGTITRLTPTQNG